MDEDWRNTFGILMCSEICDGAGAGLCDGPPLTCSSLLVCLSMTSYTCTCMLYFIVRIWPDRPEQTV